MRMPKHGFKSKSKLRKIILKTDFINQLLEKKLVSDKAKLDIGQITNLSKSNKNSYVKFLFGKKLNKPVSIQAHAVSANALKEFQRIGAEVDIIKFKKEPPTKSNEIKKKTINKKQVPNVSVKKTVQKKLEPSVVKKKAQNKKSDSISDNKSKESSTSSNDKPKKKK